MAAARLRLGRTELEHLAAAPVPAPLAEALRVFTTPEVLVDADVVVRRAASPAGTAQLHSRQRLRGDRVVALSAAGAAESQTFELAWFDARRWGPELARVVTLDAEGAEPPPTDAQLPYELLSGGCAAIRLGRPDLLAELARRHPGRTTGDGAELVRRLADAAGRMQATVAGRGRRGDRRIGWLSWVLFRDGWRALTPYVERGTPMVRVAAVAPTRLGVDVARLVRAARS